MGASHDRNLSWPDSSMDSQTHTPESAVDPEEIKERAVAIALELEGVPVADAFKVLALAMASKRCRSRSRRARD